jgi:predicted nucleic acid-binding Zn ribbon protein
MTTTCLQCGTPLSGNPRKKFCTDTCRWQFSNQQTGHNNPPLEQEKQQPITTALNRLTTWLCWYHGIAPDHPYIMKVRDAIEGDHEEENGDDVQQFPSRNCRQCGVPFTPIKKWQWFCSNKCDQTKHKEDLQWKEDHPISNWKPEGNGSNMPAIPKALRRSK